ncbi:MAG: exopolysaccharide biosynthesis protein [Arenimonas sp.]|uniref:exopolysaccharide biosynthesis protein n=1 Tax=Arenimonas sp. TaxID=1872635 RepID=UPI0025BA74C7|nr:exopolysaccharide biosynthesis protein [Arenimonas sp.]MBW8368012.1 exopolysaccharide biosynthesis protein [Arenimonas sp.]
MSTELPLPPQELSLGEQLRSLIDQIPDEGVNLGALLDVFGDEGLLLLTAMMVLVFLVPVSIPGVSTVFGAAILMVGVSRLTGRALWLPRRLRERSLPGARVRAALAGGLRWVQRFERVSRPHRLRKLAEQRGWLIVGNLAFISAALLLMAPLSFLPFSNTLPGVALLMYSIGFIQRDGGAVLAGHVAQLASVVYFSVVLVGGGAALRALWA